MQATYRIADQQDEAALRRILRATTLPGWISLSYQREPDYFAAGRADTAEHVTVVAEIAGEVIGFFSRTVREAFVDGEMVRLGYLGELRVDPRHRHRLSLLKGGYEFWKTRLRSHDDLPWDLTAILADNNVARRLLEKEGTGLPAYRRLGEICTLAFAPSRNGRSARVREVSAEDVARYSTFINAVYRRRAFAPCASPAELHAMQRNGGRLLGIESDGEILACGALWDRRAFRQEVVRGYAPPAGFLRPAINVIAPLAGLPRLPAIGSCLPSACLAWLAIKPGCEDELLPEMLSAVSRLAREQGMELLLAAWPESSHELQIARRSVRALEYRSVLYGVEAGPGGLAPLDGRQPLHLEVAHL